MRHLIFTYGSLLPGILPALPVPLHNPIEDSIEGQVDVDVDGELYLVDSNDSWPYTIMGIVYEIEEEDLPDLDEYEGINYRRGYCLTNGGRVAFVYRDNRRGEIGLGNP